MLKFKTLIVFLILVLISACGGERNIDYARRSGLTQEEWQKAKQDRVQYFNISSQWGPSNKYEEPHYDAILNLAIEDNRLLSYSFSFVFSFTEQLIALRYREDQEWKIEKIGSKCENESCEIQSVSVPMSLLTGRQGSQAIDLTFESSRDSAIQFGAQRVTGKMVRLKYPNLAEDSIPYVYEYTWYNQQTQFDFDYMPWVSSGKFDARYSFLNFPVRTRTLKGTDFNFAGFYFISSSTLYDEKIPIKTTASFHVYLENIVKEINDRYQVIMEIPWHD